MAKKKKSPLSKSAKKRRTGRSHLERITNVGVKTFEVNDKKFKIGSLVPEDFALARAHVREIQPYKLDDVLKRIGDNPNLSEAVQTAMVTEAMRQDEYHGTLTSQWARDWISTAEGMSYFLWLSARHSNDALTFEDCFEYMQKLNEEIQAQIMDMIDEATGLDSTESKGKKK